MPKLSPLQARFSAACQSLNIPCTPEHLAALAQAAKPLKEPSAKTTKRDDTEEREVVQEFCRASGIKEPPNLWTKPSQREAVLWIAPAKRVIHQCNGKSKIAIVEGVKALRAARLTCATPLSAEKMAIDWHAKQSGVPEESVVIEDRVGAMEMFFLGGANGD